MKKLFALTLSALMLLLTLAACTDNIPDDTADSDTDPIDNGIVIFQKGVDTKYKIIYADDSSADVRVAANGLAYNIQQKFDYTLMEVTAEYAEWGISGAIDTEILIGDTLRNESKETKALLGDVPNGYAIKLFDNGKIAIVATDQNTLKEGIYYFMNTLVVGEESDTLTLPKSYSYVAKVEIESASWKLKVPAYDGGIIAARTYSTGLTGNFASSTTAGKMHTIAGTNETEFKAYIQKLENEGYTQTAANQIENNFYYQYSNGSKTCYAYYVASFKEARIIEDYSTVTMDKFEYTYTAKAGETAAIYQYGMMYDDNGTGGTITANKPYENNGAFLIIRLSDNSLILIDGGRPNQASAAATEALMDFLYEITGVDKNGTEKIRVACLFFSHGDGDHYNFTYNLLKNNDYSSRLDIERIMHNFPDTSVSGTDSTFSKLGAMLYEKYPNVKFLKAHTGQNIQLGDANIEILYTHEDMVDATSGTPKIRNNNNLLSTMFKLTVNGVSFLQMGDWGVGAGEDNERIANYMLCEERFLGMYKNADGEYPTLKCDILQVAHHGINDGNGRVHAIVKADYAFFSQQDVAYDDMAHPCYKNIVDQLRTAGMEDEHMYFAGRQTNWLTIDQDGNITHGKKKIEGVDEERYWYVDSAGKVLYIDINGNINTSGNGMAIEDTTGDRIFEDMTGVTAVKMPSYWDHLAPYEPFYPANNV